MIIYSITIFEKAIVSRKSHFCDIHTSQRCTYLYILNRLFILARRRQPYFRAGPHRPTWVHTYCTLCFALFHLIPPIEDLFTGANHIRGLLGTRTQAPQGAKMRKEGQPFLLSLILTPKRLCLPHREKKGIEGRVVAIIFVLAYSGGNIIKSKKVWPSLLIHVL
jgi:hypothetical protein